MKKLGIMTYHRANNYGAVLQAYALQKYLEMQNVENEIVDYRSTYLEKAYRGISFSGELKNVFSTLSNLPIGKMKDKKFGMFRNEYLKLSKKYSDSEILNADEDFDSFIFGSDQIWNYDLSGNDQYYLGSFVKNAKKLNSYAASFGTYRSAEEKYVCLLKRFNNVSIREDSGADFFKNITGRKDVATVVDPVFLLEKGEWEKLAYTHPQKNRYIFLYTLQGKATQMMKVAQELSKKTGLPIIEMQAWFRPKPRNVKPRYWDDPIAFLSWIHDADFVITDSFHCTAFSIIFQKNFGVRITESKRPKDSRVGNLLNSLHLESQIISNDKLLWDYQFVPDYDVAMDQLCKAVKNSKEFLKGIVSEEIIE